MERSGTAAVGDAASTAMSSHGLRLSEVVSGRPSKQSPDAWQSEDESRNAFLLLVIHRGSASCGLTYAVLDAFSRPHSVE